MSVSPDSSKPLQVVESPTAIDWCYTQREVHTYLYKWTIPNFSFCSKKIDEFMESSEFPTASNANVKCHLHLYPKGRSNSDRGFAILHLKLESSNDVEAIMTKMSLLTATTEKFGTQKTSLLPVRPHGLYGFDTFLELNVINCETNGLLPNDTLTILFELSVSDSSTNISQSNIVVPKCHLIEDFANLLMNAESADVTLTVDDHEITAHKAILGARSQVFAAMFKHRMEESKLGRVVITDMPLDAVNEMLYFIYTGKSPNLDQMPGELLVAADKYDLKTLKAMCEQELLVKMSSEKAAETLILADRHNAQQLKLHTINFINNNALAVFATPGWKILKKSHLDLIAEIYESMFIQRIIPVD